MPNTFNIDSDVLERLGVLANILQVASFSNTEKIMTMDNIQNALDKQTKSLLHELVEQNKILQWQNTELLKQTKLLQQQNELLKIRVDKHINL